MYKNKPVSVTSDVATSADRASLTRGGVDNVTSPSVDLYVVIPLYSPVLAPGVRNSTNITIHYRIRVSSEDQWVI